jgi:hypothetical protein
MDAGNSFGGGNPEIKNINQEQAQGAPAGFEQLPQPQNIETPVEVGKETEQAIANQETQPTFPQAQPPQAIPTQQSPTPIQPLQPDAANKPAVVAGHANHIEKSWLGEGDKIVQETRDDPHAQKIRLDGLKDKYQEARYGEEREAA